MKYIIKSIDNLYEKDHETIKKFIEDYYGLVFHEIHFNKIASKYFNTDFKYLLLYSDNNTLLAFCPIHVKQKGILKTLDTKIPFDVPYGGWLFNSEEVDLGKLLARVSEISINQCLNYRSDIQMNKIDFSKSVLGNVKLVEHKTAIINLANEEKFIWEKIINPKKRNKVQKARKSGITIISKLNIEGLNDIWPVIKSLHEKLGYKHLTKEYYTEVLTYYFDKGQANILLAIKNDKVISGIILIGNKYFIHYWKGATILGAKNEGQGELLQWEAIKWAKKNRAKYYDLCVVEPERLPHIAKFKMGFSNQIKPFYVFSKKSFIYNVINRVQKVFIN